MAPESSSQLSVVKHSPKQAQRITQRLLLQERDLAEQIRQLKRARAKLREQIRTALERGAKCQAGVLSAEIASRHVLHVR